MGLTRLNGTSDAVGSISHALLGLVESRLLRIRCDGLRKFFLRLSANSRREGVESTKGQRTVREGFAAGIRHVELGWVVLVERETLVQ